MNALANHLWQSTAFAAVAALLAFALRQNTASNRHRVWLAASLKFLVPFALLSALGSQVGSRAPLPPIASPKIAAQVDALAIEWSRPPGLLSHPSPLPTVALILWAAGALFFVARWIAAWFRLRGLVRSATLLPLPFPTPVRSTTSTIEPGVFGIFRPVLLLPEGIADHLSPAQFQAILDHEAAHVRRRDNLWSALHMAVEAIFWFHPLVWWIGAHLSDERERACDEEVLRNGSRAEAYAESILAACKLYLESPLPCVSGVTGADLKKRIERIMADRIGRNLRLHTKVAIAAGAALAIGLPIAAGLLRAQTPAPLSFEVASIKPNHSGSFAVRMRPRRAGGLIVENATLRMLVMIAYGINPHQLSGGPAWANDERFDVDAKADGASREQVSQMLQTLLAERFHLAAHRETRELPIYALVTAKGGPKLQDSKADTSQITDTGPGTFVAEKFPMDMLARQLEIRLEHTVVNETSLTGKYDLKLNWVPDRLRASPAGSDSEPHPTSDATGPSIFTALQEQLGLRLESRKGPVEVVVIDRVEKLAEN